MLLQNFKKIEMLQIYHKLAGQEQLCQKETNKP
jgi:hypothetical protein